jgi:methanogenic corrinoid protein MtbC1
LGRNVFQNNLAENSVKICVGGAAASALVAERCGLDYYAATAVEGVNWAKSF